MKYLLFAILFFFVAFPVQSKSLKAGQSGGHEADIYSVLPFERNEKISKLILTIHNNIDFPIGYFDGLRDAPHQSFTWHKYGHRVFFHWGFNSNPRSSKILQELVAERKWPQEVEKFFWDKVITEQARRNRETMAIVGSTLGFQLSGAERVYANAFASIITDVHILGDYSTTNTTSLQNIDLVVADIKNALFESLKGGDDAKRINRLLDSTKSISSQSKRADAILKILQKELAQFILTVQNGYFKRLLVKQKLPLRQKM